MKLAIVAFFITLLSCSVSKKSEPGGVEVRAYFPIIDWKGGILETRDTINVYWLDDLIIYKLPFQKEFVEIGTNRRFGWPSFYYFCHRTSDSLGLLFDSLGVNKDLTWLSLDSIKRTRAYATKYGELEKYSTSFAVDSSANMVKEKYGFDGSGNMFDSATLFYDKRYNDLRFSFDDKFQLTKKLKLYRAELLWKEKVIDGRHYDKRVATYEMSDLGPLPNSFQKFLKNIKDTMRVRSESFRH
ncbi:MAG: hypothetical protein DI535_21000 [Citrobacter freundii]|nr:MAG: hypothetical protein DI535_21000 [Citrobacter freundii]